MQTYCGNCFQDTLNDRGICNVCGFDNNKNLEKSPHALPPGSILNGRYIVGKVLGQGGFGITYTAKDYQTGQIMAIKEFFPDSMAMRTGKTSVIPFSGDRGENFIYGRDSFLLEARTMAEFIGNPNIVRVYSYFEENGTAYFVMEYVDGLSLHDYLRSKGGRISFEDAVQLLLPIMDALSAVHEKGIIHRDVAPDNIHISRDGTVKLLDFGAARYSLGNVSRSLDMILKHGFAPKEQYKRRGHQGPYTDVYSLAATIYFAITGTRPDDAIERSDEDEMPYPSSLGARINAQQEDVLLTAMAVDAENRYQTMAGFRDAVLGTLRQSTPVPEPPKPPRPPKPVNPPKPDPDGGSGSRNKNKKWIIAGIGALAAIAIFFLCYSNCVFGHSWKAATCTDARTCRSCGITEGKALGHDYTEATCTDPKTCIRCGHTSGSASHDFKAATCTEAKTCKNCGITSGSSKGHEYKAATCTTAKICTVCKATSGAPLGHNWEAVSGRIEKCSRCGETQKNQDGLVETLAGHWSSARSDVGGTRTPTWVFEETVEGCTELTLHYQIVSVSQGDPFGAHKLYAKNTNGKWVVIGKFEVKNKNGFLSEGEYVS